MTVLSRIFLLQLITILTLTTVYCFTTRSYDLDVPGSKPIRIIEAEPGWDLNTRKPSLQSTYQPNDRIDRLESIKSNYKPFTHRGDKEDRFKHRPDFEHRTLRPDLISDRHDRFPALGSEEGNSERLKEFLNSYAENVKKLNIPGDNSENGNGNEDLLHLDDKFVDLPSDEQVPVFGLEDKPEKSKSSWNLLHFDKIQRPQDQKEWVAMEAVPWSVSKISKWHGKPKKDKYQTQNNHHGFYDSQSSRPYNDRFSQNSQPDFIRPIFPKPLKPVGVSVAHRPSGYYDDPLEEGDVEDSVEDDYYNKKPSFPRPSATYGHKVNLHTVQNYGGSNNGNKRPYNNDNPNCNNPNHQHSHNNQNDDGIITDGLPSNFPDHDYGNRRRGVSDSVAGSTALHPFKGDGEWVLLSTTKGYKYPKTPRQRSLRFGDTVPEGGENGLQTIHTHKSVHLTVLPPLNDGRINMTTSHGGLLQVDGTFQSVEEAAHKHHIKRQRLKLRPTRRPSVNVRPQLGGIKAYPLSNQLQYQVENEDNIAAGSSDNPVSDSSAVLAAVGAGMIPAGMALLVPMAMNGKRKRRQVKDFPTTTPYTSTLELTLPSSL